MTPFEDHPLFWKPLNPAPFDKLVPGAKVIVHYTVQPAVAAIVVETPENGWVRVELELEPDADYTHGTFLALTGMVTMRCD